NADPYDGPWTSYVDATRRDELVASVDPVALDIWAVKNILVPAFIANGFSPPWPSPSADPDDPASAFRQYLDNSMYQILAAGHEVTNDPTSIDVESGNGSAGDFDGDGDVDFDDYDRFAQCFTGPGGGPVGAGCVAGDFDGDDDIDCDDWDLFEFVWTVPLPPPSFPPCATTGVEDAGSPPVTRALVRATPNPMRSSTTISYTLTEPGRVVLTLFDVTGRSLATLVDAAQAAGEHAVIWDGRTSTGDRVGDGVYVYHLETAGRAVTGKLVVSR
ncbi:MAG: FlgD immunoglobulin-like domain containing protein, partial [Candidatus Eiseniibacteriota bacterium]